MTTHPPVAAHLRAQDVPGSTSLPAALPTLGSAAAGVGLDVSPALLVSRPHPLRPVGALA